MISGIERRSILAAGLLLPINSLAPAARISIIMREPSNQPFSASSVWNTPIGSGAQWSTPASDPGTAQLVTITGNINAGNWGQPHFIGAATDPLVVVTCTDNMYPISPQSIHIPKTAQPALPTNGDRHMAFFDLTNPTKMWSYWGCQLNNGVDVTGGITAGLGGVYDVCGDGIHTIGNTGTPPTFTGTSGDYNFAIGTIRDWELTAGIIQHTLRYAVSASVAKSTGSTWITNVPWPDHHEDYDGPTAYTGKLLYGSTIGIPASVNLNSLGLSAGGLILATALQHYGAIMRDTGGSNSCTFYAEPISETSPVLAQMRTDMGKIVPQLRVLLNQSPTRKNFGGTSSAAGPPPIDSTICPGTVAAKASPAGTIVPTTSITDASDNVSTIDNTKVAVNGTVDGSTANVVKLAYVVLPGMAIWHENLSNKLVLQDRSNRRMRLGWCAFCQLLLVLRDWPGDSGTRTDRAWAAWRHRKAISCHHILTHWNRGRKMRGWLRHGPTAR